MTKISALTSHPGEDVLELYCLDRLDESEAASIEEHLLVCEACQKRVTELDVFLKAAKQAMRDLRSEERYSRPQSGWNWLFRPGWAAAGALAMLALVAVPTLRRPAETQELSVSALRGASEQSGGAVAEAGRPLRVNLDLTGLASGECCLLQLVSAEGKVLHRWEAAPTNGQASLDHAALRAGQYWIRVKTNSGEDLREFGLTVR